MLIEVNLRFMVRRLSEVYGSGAENEDDEESEESGNEKDGQEIETIPGPGGISGEERRVLQRDAQKDNFENSNFYDE